MESKRKNYSFKDKKISRKQAGKYTAIVFVLVLAMFWLFPFILMLNNSFKSLMESAWPNKMTDVVKEPTLDPYTAAAEAMDFWTSLWVSIGVTVLSNITIIFFSTLAAWQLVRSNKLYAKVIFYTILVTMIVPFQAIMMPLMSIMFKMHLSNLPGLVFMYTGFGMGISIFMMHGFLKGVPISLEEAAKVEGYGPFRVYWKIVLPLLKPIIVTIVLLNTMWIWNDFLLPNLVKIQSGNPDALTTLPVNMLTGLIGTYGAKINSLMAGLTIMIIPATIFFVFMQKQIIAGITNGAVK